MSKHYEIPQNAPNGALGLEHPITTTLARIREAKPCSDGYKKLCKYLGGVRTYGKNTPLRFSQIAISNGLDDALWCLKTVLPKHDKEVRLLRCDFAADVLHIFEQRIPHDNRLRKCIETSKRFAYGQATKQELIDARDEVSAVAFAVAGVRDEAWTAAMDALRAATWASALDTTVTETVTAAQAAAWAALRAAAQNGASRAAARAAAQDETEDASQEALTWNTTWNTTWAAARAKQIKLLIMRFG